MRSEMQDTDTRELTAMRELTAEELDHVAVGSGLGGLVGGIVGGMIGGPIGALVGSEIGDRLV